ncbi:hypothetical protein AMTRI_Chr03g46980 [Amborella trichopoda]
MINHKLNCRIGKNGCYHIPLYWLRSRARDKRTRTANISHKLTTFIVLCSPKSNSSQNQSKGAKLESHFKDSCGTESSPPFPPDYLVLRILVLRMSDCPSPTLTAQPERGQLMRSTY